MPRCIIASRNGALLLAGIGLFVLVFGWLESGRALAADIAQGGGALKDFVTHYCSDCHNPSDIELGADVNSVDDNGETPMHGAAYRNFPLVVHFLAEHGAKADVWNKKNKHGCTPLEIAQGHRFGNFKPSAETETAIREVLNEPTRQ